MKKEYTLWEGYYIKDITDKEELLDLLITIRSQKGMTTSYSYLKKLSVEQLLEELKKVKDSNRFNGVCTVYDMANNRQVLLCNIKDNKRVVELENGTTIFVDFLKEYSEYLSEISLEGNEINLPLRVLNVLEELKETKKNV